MSRWSVIPMALFLSTFNLCGCITTQTWEIDATSAKDFHWDGRIRIVEQTSDEIGPFLSLHKRTSAHSIELVGDNGRNLVVRPSGHAANEHPVGRLETADEPNRPIQTILSMSLQKEFPMMVSAAAGQPKATTAPSAGTEQNDAAEKRLNEEFIRYSHIRQTLSDHKFDQLSSTEAIAAASSGVGSIYTVFDLGDGVTLKAWLENHDPASVCATVYDRDGKVLHEYKPTNLPMKEVYSTER
jgi:hypothetical protein